MSEIAAILRAARAVLESIDPAAAGPYLRRWPAVLAPCPPTAHSLPVLDWLPVAERSAPRGPLETLASSICAAAGALQWQQTYREPDVSRDFLDAYGWSEFVGRGAPVASATLAVGVLLLGPRTHYPAHHHLALELYVPISGTARWQQGGAPFAARAPGTAIQHASDEPHAMQTEDEPLLALYCWRGAGIGDSASLGAPA
ncbi:MAG: transcriptional regulator [Proteobacteria bacterium]|nr:transcriptional regulator [Pseudomonadota bacterium]